VLFATVDLGKAQVLVQHVGQATIAREHNRLPRLLEAVNGGE
jgi:hypothetical protein